MIMTTTVMSLKTDKKIKEKAQKLAKKMGFPLGTLINAFLRQFVRDEAIHFTMMPMSKTLERTLSKVEKDIKNDKNISPAFNNPEELFNYLDSQK